MLHFQIKQIFVKVFIYKIHKRLQKIYYKVLVFLYVTNEKYIS